MERNLPTMHIVNFWLLSWASPFLSGRFFEQVRVCVDAFFNECVFSWTLSCTSACFRGRMRVFFSCVFSFFLLNIPSPGVCREVVLMHTPLSHKVLLLILSRKIPWALRKSSLCPSYIMAIFDYHLRILSNMRLCVLVIGKQMK